MIGVAPDVALAILTWTSNLLFDVKRASFISELYVSWYELIWLFSPLSVLEVNMLLTWLELLPSLENGETVEMVKPSFDIEITKRIISDKKNLFYPFFNHEFKKQIKLITTSLKQVILSTIVGS